MRINLIVNSFPTVSETFLFNKVTGLESLGHTVLVCSLNEAQDLKYYQERLEEWSGNKVYYFQQKWIFVIALLFDPKIRKKNKLLRKEGKSLKNRLRILRKYYFINSRKPDIIHFAFSGIAAEFHDVIKLNSGAKVFFSCRGSAEKIRPLIDFQRIEKLKSAFKNANRVHCVSEDMRKTVAKYGGTKEKTFINFPSINIQKFTFNKRVHQYLKLNDAPFKILSTGRLHFQKGYVYALLAIKQLRDKGIKIEYNICGGGPEEGLLKYMVQELDLGASIRMHGKVSSTTVVSMLAETDIFLLPSIYEGIANAALEAIASGVPLITTKAGGMNEVIQNKENGLIVDRFSADQLAEGISFYYNNPETALRFAEKALETLMGEFLHEQQIRIFEQEYQSILQN
ncbi:MAG: colanic acid biosynthesis glycosyltransferase WcaL [Saprospiraceae bacterium]